jgi:hypothetical protein
MKTNIKKTILSAAFIVAICSVCLTVNAAPAIKTANTIAVSDTGKMDKMSKPMKKKKMDKMSKDKMKKDTSKMSKM